MADPTKYVTEFDFSGYQSTNPSSPLPGPSVDNELANVETSIDEIVDAITDIRRSDGALVNGIVTRDALADEVADLAGASAYQVAVDDGFVGDETAWLLSLKGDAATIAVGTVTTGAAGTDAIVTNAGTSAAAVFNITIPRGATGATGAGTGDMLAAVYDPTAVGGDVFNMANMAEAADAKVLTAAERTKLAGIATAATANSADATLLARANHTGTQLAATISDFSTAADARVTAAIGTPGATGLAILADTTAGAVRTEISAAARAQTDFISGVIVEPVSGDYRLVINIPYAISITKVTTRSAAGTATATVKINTTALGGTANSVSTTEQSQTHSTANAVVIGDDIVMTLASISSCTYLSFTIEFTRTLA